jgi:uncharacterized RDD family membrane protein YckC
LFLSVSDEKDPDRDLYFPRTSFFRLQGLSELSCLEFRLQRGTEDSTFFGKPAQEPYRGTRRSRNGRDTEALSTLPNQVKISPKWKQEVNLRVAAHKDRKAAGSAEPEAISEVHHGGDRRAAEAAARVAARFAKAPSYSEMAGEARAAVRAAEAASRAALEAQAAAESILAGLEAASQAEPVSADGFASENAVDGPARESNEYEIRWEPDLPQRQEESTALRTAHSDETPEQAAESWEDSAWPSQPGPGGDGIETVEPALPIHANLIEFPREIIATRKVRPRLAEGAYTAPGGQLSIFEVDPASISVEPSAAVAMDVASTPSWTGPEWSGIELDAQPRREFLEEPPDESLTERELQWDQALDRARSVQIAPIGLRVMAGLVNGSLVMGVFLLGAMAVAPHLKVLPSLRGAEVASCVALAVITALYHGLFYAFAKGTPGMLYAGVSLCTFDGQKPTRAQRLGRLVAMLLSVVPMGLGIMWAIFDEDRLSWHDRLSQTYLRKH